ncbi:MAG: HD domain-containing protein [Bacteroidota bacterium]|nr:HD domain-containing protein [Bacteroidota bacterium]
MANKEFFTREYDNIFRFHRSGASGLEVASELSQLVDSTLTKLWEELPEEPRNTFAVVALGGYGRFEMAPHSDVDVMILFKDEQIKVANADTAQQFLHSLWNLGFDVGHSVRTIKDCLNLYQTDVDVWASVLESRYVCGNSELMDQYTTAFLAHIEKNQDLKFISSVITGVDERHKKYEHSVKLLEPNLKNSAGGVRDLHSLVWVYRSTNIKYFSLNPFRCNESGCVTLFHQLADDGIISSEELGEAIHAFDGILRIRNELHYHSGSQQDILEFSKQLEIAQAIGYRLATPVESVEVCMREYFLHGRVVYRLNKLLINQFRKTTATSVWSKIREQVLDDFYMIRNGQLFVRNVAKEFSSPADIVRAFYWCGVHSVELSSPLHSSLSSLLRNQKFFASDTTAVAKVFLEILRLPENVAATLQMMNDADVLGKIIEEWGNLVAFFQHSMYHYYTTDAHTLIALEHAEKLQKIDSVLGKTFHSLPHKVTLYLAILFHDIAKPQGIQGHEITGVDIWKKVKARFGFPDDHDDVAFLIRNHLIMEQIAFRRNTNDRATIEDFAKNFSRPEQLDMLFILTYSDLSAVNKNVWTSWKEMLLQELYLKTRKLLTQKSEFVEQAFSTPYSRNELDEFESQIKTLDAVSVIFKSEDAHTKVVVITRDAPFLLSTICGVLSANDVNIFDAQIYTREDGFVMDSFRVVDAATKRMLSPELQTMIVRDMENVLTQKETLEKLFDRHHRRWKRRAKPLMHPNIRIDVDFQDSTQHTIIDIYAPDMTGFLYKITQTLSKAKLQIDFAKLATRGDGIVDAFYVQTQDGKKISSNEQKLFLREKILHTIEQLMNVQLEV